jgi:hypothetical protein
LAEKVYEDKIMAAKVKVDPGVCGFEAEIVASTEDGMTVDLEIESDCQTIKELAQLLKDKTPLDAYQELSPESESEILALCRPLLVQKGCCEACIVPQATCKAMYVAAGLALPKDVSMQISKD